MMNESGIGDGIMWLLLLLLVMDDVAAQGI